MLTIEPGTAADLAALERFHYRGGRPATIARVLRAVDDSDGLLAGVLVVSRPTLNGPWRRVAWPDLFPATLGRRRAARRLNRHVRTISRVIVDPRLRGTGVARALVARYLAAPLTPRTEALAAMGRFCPFFQAAGMREIPHAPSRRDAALAAALRRERLRPDALLAAGAVARVRRSRGLRRAVRAWLRASRATRGRRLSLAGALPRAAQALIAPPAAYVRP